MTEQELAEILSLAVHSPDTKIRLAPADEVPNSGSALVLGARPLEELERRVRTVAMRELPAPYVYSQLQSAVQASPLVAWIASGIVAAAIALAVGCFIALVDRLLGTREHRRQLLNLGVSPHRLAALDAWQFAAPYGTVSAIGFSAGLAICALMVAPDTPMPWLGIGVTLGITIIIGLFGTASVALFGARSVRDNSELKEVENVRLGT